MVNPCECHIQHFKVWRSLHHFRRIGVIGKNDNLTLPGAADELSRVSGLLSIGGELVSPLSRQD